MGTGGTTRLGFFAVFTITHNPIILQTASTSTIVTSTTSFTTSTVSVTSTETDTSTPVAVTTTAHVTVTKTVKISKTSMLIFRRNADTQLRLPPSLPNTLLKLVSNS